MGLIRHTVAHHAALVRRVDVPRFQYWELRPSQLLNPPPEFVKEVAQFIYTAGADYEKAVRHRVFSVVVPRLAPFPTNAPLCLIAELIELFNFLGELPMDHEPPTLPGSPEAVTQAERRRDALLQSCLTEICAAYL